MQCNMMLVEEYKQHQAQARQQMRKFPWCSKQWCALSLELLNEISSLTSIPPLRKSEPSPWLSTTCDKAHVLAETFIAKSKLPERSTSQTLLAPPHVQMADFVIFRSRWAKRILKRINADKAIGPDGFPGRLLKECAAELAPYYCLNCSSLYIWSFMATNLAL